MTREEFERACWGVLGVLALFACVAGFFYEPWPVAVVNAIACTAAIFLATGSILFVV